MVGSHPGMHGRKLEGTDAIDPEDDELRLAIEASLADMNRIRPSAPGAVEDQEQDYKVHDFSKIYRVKFDWLTYYFIVTAASNL